MKMKLILIPVIAGSMFMSGCASLLFGGLSMSGSSGGDSGSYDDSTARNQWEADAQMDSWLNQQAEDQSNAAATQMMEDASNEASAAAAASATAASAAVNP
jgi:osmotically-inducible protein OsmY